MPNLLLRRPVLSPWVLNLITAAYVMILCNAGFWRTLHGALGTSGDTLVFGAAVFGLTLFTFACFTLPYVQRPVLALLILVASAASFYQSRFGILIDRDMIQNIMRTTPAESRQLITGDYVLYLGLTGVLPAMLVFLPRIAHPRRMQLLWRWPAGIVATLTLTLGLIYSDYATIASTVREHREILGSYQPGASIGAVARYVRLQMRSSNLVVEDLGTDAAKGPRIEGADKPVLLVLFAGETARAQNFGLNGYARDTTPELAKRDVIAFTDTTSCGTATAVSIPCMFSPFTRSEYSETKFRGSENLMDVLEHAGVKTVWWDNNTGSQNVADRIETHTVEATLDPAACASGECTDAALLPIIQQTANTMTEDTVLVLHMAGSHGPGYYQRYPDGFGAFQPACTTTNFRKCTTEEIVNAYDNSILFTDHVLAQAIDMLAAQSRVIPAVVFLSDHGESLEENGLYLHAAPRFMAPDEQTHVPFVMWLPPSYTAAMRIDTACVKAKTSAPTSQDNLFHTVLGMMDITTKVHDPSLDLTAQCQGAGA
nr:phosphoethanolamine--lipid A transferase [Falsirhodobacter halotolerans]